MAIKKSKEKSEEKLADRKLGEVVEETLEGKKLEKAAEKESTEEKTLNDLEKKKKALLEKAAKLKEKLTEEIPSTEELKEKIKIKKRTDMLIPLEEYVKSGIYLGTKVVTPEMKPFVYRRRADGLAIFNTDLIDEKLKEGVEYLSKFEPNEIILVCKRQAGWKAASKFSELTGIRTFTKKYPAGILTNTTLPDFFENELTIVIDSWLDKNALHDTLRVKKKVLMVCDTNNFGKGADKIIIGNNKSPKSLGVIFYILAKGYCKEKGIEADIPDLEWWTEEFEEGERGASKGV
jgi:small subunit ribosomal protein S2